MRKLLVITTTVFLLAMFAWGQERVELLNAVIDATNFVEVTNSDDWTLATIGPPARLQSKVDEAVSFSFTNRGEVNFFEGVLQRFTDEEAAGAFITAGAENATNDPDAFQAFLEENPDFAVTACELELPTVFVQALLFDLGEGANQLVVQLNTSAEDGSSVVALLRSNLPLDQLLKLSALQLGNLICIAEQKAAE